MDGRTFDDLARSFALRTRSAGGSSCEDPPSQRRSTAAGSAGRGRPPRQAAENVDLQSRRRGRVYPRHYRYRPAAGLSGRTGAELDNGCCSGSECGGGDSCSISVCDVASGNCEIGFPGRRQCMYARRPHQPLPRAVYVPARCVFRRILQSSVRPSSEDASIRLAATQPRVNAKPSRTPTARDASAPDAPMVSASLEPAWIRRSRSVRVMLAASAATMPARMFAPVSRSAAPACRIASQRIAIRT